MTYLPPPYVPARPQPGPEARAAATIDVVLAVVLGGAEVLWFLGGGMAAADIGTASAEREWNVGVLVLGIALVSAICAAKLLFSVRPSARIAQHICTATVTVPVMTWMAVLFARSAPLGEIASLAFYGGILAASSLVALVLVRRSSTPPPAYRGAPR